MEKLETVYLGVLVSTHLSIKTCIEENFEKGGLSLEFQFQIMERIIRAISSVA